MAALSPGSTIRFRVRDADGSTGSSWSVKTKRQSGDVYVAHREGGRWVKPSFHEGGQWHYQITEPDGSVYLGVVKEHSEIYPGWLHAMRITVDRAELRTGWVEQVSDRPVIDIPAHPNFDGVSIDVLLGTADAIPIDAQYMVGEIMRGDSGSVVILGLPTRLEEPVRVALGEEIEKVMTELRTSGWNGAPGRLVLPGAPVDGYLWQVEIAVDAE